MLLAFDFFCLFLTLFAFLHYIVTGFHSSTHRLLPLSLGLIGVYDCYLIIELIYGPSSGFHALKVLLLLQELPLLLYYIFDILHFKMRPWMSVMVFLSVALADIAELSHESWGKYSYFVLWTYIFGMVLANVAVATYGLFLRIYSRQIVMLHRLLYITLLVPSIGLIIAETTGIGEATIMPACFAVSCSILNYLVSTNKMRDTDAILKEDLFANLDAVMVLFDADCSYIDSNIYTKEKYPEVVAIAEYNRSDYPMKELVSHLAQHVQEEPTMNLGGIYFRAHMQEVYYKGKLRGYILSLTDVTSERQALADANRQTRAKSDFLANISHDLRSPLHAIIGGTDIILGRGDMAYKSKQMVLRIREAGNRLLGLVDSVLEFSKLEAGDVEFHNAPYEMEQVLREIADECLMNLGIRPVDFRAEVKTRIPHTLLGDRIRIMEILQNPLSNSMKFTQEGYIACEISCEEAGEHRVKVIAEIKDTGLGIPDEVVANIFDAYTSYANVYAREGTGLGLNIVSRLTKALDGETKVESQVGKGSVITMSFYQNYVGDVWDEPYIIDKNRQYDRTPLEYEVRPNWVYPSARVLVADDLKVNREIFYELTRPWKILVDEASDGDQAVEMAKETQYDLIVLDQMMPRVNGTEAADKIAGFSSAPTILISADISDGIQHLAEVHGMSGYLPKPMDLQKLQEQLECLLPKEKRVLPDGVEDMDLGGILYGQAYELTLRAFVEELLELYPLLPEYARNDLELFRTKVHGVKGISRQLGRKRLGGVSEVMEMAAKAGHEPFIERNLEPYLEEMYYTIEEAKRELAIR